MPVKQIAGSETLLIHLSANESGRALPRRDSGGATREMEMYNKLVVYLILGTHENQKGYSKRCYGIDLCPKYFE